MKEKVMPETAETIRAKTILTDAVNVLKENASPWSMSGRCAAEFVTIFQMHNNFIKAIEKTPTLGTADGKKTCLQMNKDDVDLLQKFVSCLVDCERKQYIDCERKRYQGVDGVQTVVENLDNYFVTLASSLKVKGLTPMTFFFNKAD